jgi:hypothetical protein
MVEFCHAYFFIRIVLFGMTPEFSRCAQKDILLHTVQHVLNCHMPFPQVTRGLEKYSYNNWK